MVSPKNLLDMICTESFEDGLLDRLLEGIGADGLSGEVDKDGPGSYAGGSPYSEYETDQDQPPVNAKYNRQGQRVENHAINGKCPYCGSSKFDGLLPTDFESQHCSKCGRVVVTEEGGDNLAYSGSGPLTFVDPSAQLPWNGRTQRKLGRMRRRRQVGESEGWMLGYPTDATFTGRIQIKILDNTNIKVLAPYRTLESLEAYHFFEQFQFLLPKTPMLNVNVMDSIARWWRNYAERGDLLEIDCTTGYATVTNERKNNIYSLGCLGSVPTYTGIVS